jgi:hypothetical protein
MAHGGPRCCAANAAITWPQRAAGSDRDYLEAAQMNGIVGNFWRQQIRIVRFVI